MKIESDWPVFKLGDRCMQVPDNVATVLNAGTLYRKDRPGCLLLDLVAREARFFDVHDEREPTLASRHPF